METLKIQYNQLDNEILLYESAVGNLPPLLEKYIYSLGIKSLSEISVEDIFTYKDYVERQNYLSARQKVYFGGLLEQLVFRGLLGDYPILEEYYNQINKNSKGSLNAELRKVLAFMLLNKISDPIDVSYEDRERFADYIKGHSRQFELIKCFDVMVINSIKKYEMNNPFRMPIIKYQPKKLFLLYYPNSSILMNFYYVRDKEKELVFDFSLACSDVLKRQVFNMLVYVLGRDDHNKHTRKNKRERFIVPLRMFYLFCVEEGISDITRLTEKQREAFRCSMDGKVGTKTKTYIQIVDNIRKYLFVSSKHTDWRATVWYMERFNLDATRINFARYIERIDFSDIEIEENRSFLQEYLRYQIAVNAKFSLQTIRIQFYKLHQFLRFLDDKNILLRNLENKDIRDYIGELQKKDIQWSSYNKLLLPVDRFLTYVRTRGQEQIGVFEFDGYLKKGFIKHNDRTVSDEDQERVLAALKYFPQDLRLMFLHSWCLGLRVSEVCTIRKDAYSYDGETAWIRVYRSKLKQEVVLPIPEQLYFLMADYISSNYSDMEGYVFQNRKGGAYDAGTFSKKMKEKLLELGIEDYAFKNHDYRHTLATTLHRKGASIEVIRDFLSHKSSDMTKAYIDYLPQEVMVKNKDFLASNRWNFKDDKKG